jgi:hypothetical protein
MVSSHTLALVALMPFAGAILSSVAPAASAVQAGSASGAVLPGTIVVQVTDTSLNPLPANVLIPELDFTVRLPANGLATLEEVPDGVYRVEVRHDGHASDSRLLRVAGDTLRVQFKLVPATGEPAAPRASTPGDVAMARLRYFMERSAMLAPGVFITSSSIQRGRARTLSDVLRGVQGVKVERVARGRTIVRSIETSGPSCAEGMRIFVDGAGIAPPDVSGADATAEQTSRAARRHQAGWQQSPEGGSHQSAPALRWVGPGGGDVVRVAHEAVVAAGATAVRTPHVTDIDRLRLSSVGAMEVYSSPNSVPAEFQMPGAECGVVLIWTTGA